MEWREHITTDPDRLGGKPVVRGTRLGVEFLLGLLGAGWTTEQLLLSYPALTPEALQAVFAYSAEALRDEVLFTLHPDAA